MRNVVVVASALLACVACGRTKAAVNDSTIAGASAPAAATSSGGPLCPRTGHWSECTVRIKLDQAGLAPQSGSDKVGDLPTLSVKPFTLTIGNAGLAYYVYPDTMSRHAAAAALDTTKYIAQAKPISMKNETTLIQNDNVLVLLFSKNEHQRERVADIITGGPPQ
jgi:hypothetical protein